MRRGSHISARVRAASLAGAALLAHPAPALAHAFETGQAAYENFVDGAAVVFAYPPILLPLAALGVLLALWREEGLLRVWPTFLAAQLAGLFLAAMVGDGVETFLIALGIACAIVAALRPAAPDLPVIVLAALTGLAAMGAALTGHGLFELPLSIHLGIVFGINVALAASAGLVREALRRTEGRSWREIPWRVAASWIAAILVLVLAFALRPV